MTLAIEFLPMPQYPLPDGAVDWSGDNLGSTSSVSVTALELFWDQLGKPLAADVLPDMTASGKHEMHSVFVESAEASITVNGRPLPGPVVSSAVHGVHRLLGLSGFFRNMDHGLIAGLTASQSASQIRAGTLSCEDLMLSWLARVAQREPQIGAWQFLDATRALERVRAADRLTPLAPSHGTPVGIKDIVDTVDMPTTLGLPIYARRQPNWDAACLAALRAAGGSSSGSAAAVADCMVPLALGSRTAASVTRPAAFFGVYGYKASHGELSLSGIRPFAESLDSLGVLARSVDDSMLLRSALLGGHVTDPRPRAAPPGLAVCQTAQWSQAEPQEKHALNNRAQACRKAGAVVGELELPAQFAGPVDAQKTFMAYEAVHNYSQNGGLHEKGDEVRCFGRTSLTRWVVRIDDTNSFVIAWRNLNKVDDTEGLSQRDQIGRESVDLHGQNDDRPFSQKQSNPGDLDAWVGQRPINRHQHETLGGTDQGVRLLRNARRKGVLNLQQGNEPMVPEAGNNPFVSTFGGDAVLRVPKGAGDDRALILETSRKIADAYIRFAYLPDAERRAAIERELAPLNVT